MRFDRIVHRDVQAHAWDYALAGAMVAVALIALVTRIDVQDADAHLFRPDNWLGWVVTIAVCLTLVGRRRWPLRVLGSALALMLPLELAQQRDTVAFFAVVIALYSVAAYLPTRLAWRGIVQIAALYVVLMATGSVLLTAAPQFGLLSLGVAVASGLGVQRKRASDQRESAIAIERAAAAIETAEAEAADERLRMAQELHDVVAHSLSVIAVQAGIGGHLIDRRPAEAARSLDAIRSTCDSTGIELDRLVAILRTGRVSDSTTAPSIAAIATLVDQIRSTDLAITLHIEGELATVPAGVSFATYRIVQEALTNIVRHAGSPVDATVTIQATDDHIGLSIEDNGRGVAVHTAGTHGGGNGLVGMRERAHMYGGDVHTGPRPGGGFRVRATLDTHSGNSRKEPTRHEAPSADLDPSPARRQLSPLTWDAAVTTLMAAIAILEVITSNPTANGPDFTPNDVWSWSLRFGCVATLAFRRRRPTVAYATAWVLGLALIIGDYQFGVLTMVLLIGLYSIAAHATIRRLITAGVGTLGGIVIVALSKPPDLSASGAVWASVFFAGSAVTGYVMRRDRNRRATELSEHQIDAATRTRHSHLVLTNERLRIADELRTVLTRSIDTIACHAETGCRLVDTDTDTTRDALRSISTISRDALNDLRRLLKHLRDPTESVNYLPIPSTLETVGDNTTGVPQ